VTQARQLPEAEQGAGVDALTHAATGLCEKLGESLGSIRQFDRMAEDATTPNLEAFKFDTPWAELSISGKGIEAFGL
jgi:hypothetical protein